MTRARDRPWRYAPLLVLLAIRPEPTAGQDRPRAEPPHWSPPTSLYDPRLEPLRRASASWEARPGPDRAVVDLVCLVPDLPTFLEAIATWDRGHAFPVLFDDVESTTRFLRAFKPARVVRYPRAASPIPGERVWARAVEAVGASWSAGGGSAPTPPGDSVPRSLGATPPGVVISSPGAPMLAGAVALAAGRFQPLLRLDYPRRQAEILSDPEFLAFDAALTGTFQGRIPNHAALGDGCDFVTLAGDWPYRHRDSKGEVNAVDDRVFRSVGSEFRWAYAGRLMGDARESVYRAMCSLFLQPESAVMFNGYDESAPPWSAYAMGVPAARLSAVLPTAHVWGDRPASVEGWHETFDPANPFGLVLINSHGSPTAFHLRGGPATTPDIPRGVPSVVLMIHSFSAAEPTDPATIAGRWLANGAFIFFGSMNEPYLASFRTPRLVGELLGEKLPIVAAVRSGQAEPFGKPWRLVFLGDPLYRLKARDRPAARLGSWEPTARWPAYAEPPQPEGGSDDDRFRAALQASFARLAIGASGAPGDDLAEAVLGLRRDRIPGSSRPIFDALVVEILLRANRRGALRAWIAGVPEADRSPGLRRTFETLQAIELSQILGRGDPSKARATWSDLIRSPVPGEFKEQATARVGRLADSPARRRDWAESLRGALRDRPKSPEADAMAAELKRVEEAIQAGPARPSGR